MHALDDFDQTIGRDTCAHRARLKVARLTLHKHMRLLTGNQHRLTRHKHPCLAGAGDNFDITEHIRFEQTLGIIKLNAHFIGACFGIQIGIDVGDKTDKIATRQRADTQCSRIPDMHPGNLILIQIGQNPDARQIGNLIKLGGWRHTRPFAHADAGHHTGRRSMDMHILAYLVRTLQFNNLMFGHIKEA